MFVDSADGATAAAAAIAAPIQVATRHLRPYLEWNRVIPLTIEGATLRVAAVGQPDAEVLEDLQATYNAQDVVVEPVEKDQFEAALAKAYSSETIVEFVRGMQDDDEPRSSQTGSPVLDVRDLANQAPVIRYVNLLFQTAVQRQASDIHLETAQSGLRIRLRIDGVLSDVTPPPNGLHQAVLSRLKLLAELDIAERRKAQDGRIRVRLDARDLDVRISTLPSVHGESLVMRLLDQGGRPVSLEGLGMSGPTRAAFARLVGANHGIVIATGPTGSGKTSTLYAALGLRHADREKIITVEDPVEYRLDGIVQIPVRSKGGMTFASSLRSILRHDPDVILIGEIRDQETAAIAVQAAMTGHLVLSTLHTNNASSAVTRLRDLGLEPFQINASLRGVLAQRLVRRLCPACRGRDERDGCESCNRVGYLGRTGIFELLEMDDQLRTRVARDDPETLVPALEAAVGATMEADGLAKAAAGVTSIEEVYRVLGE